jgi:hypothetical protein
MKKNTVATKMKEKNDKNFFYSTNKRRKKIIVKKIREK